MGLAPRPRASPPHRAARRAGQVAPALSAFALRQRVFEVRLKRLGKAVPLRCPASSMRKLWMVATTITTACRPTAARAPGPHRSSEHSASPWPCYRLQRLAVGWPLVCSASMSAVRMVSLAPTTAAIGASAGAPARQQRHRVRASTVLPRRWGCAGTQGNIGAKGIGVVARLRARARPLPGLHGAARRIGSVRPGPIAGRT